MCKAFWNARKRFIECEYAPSFPVHFASLEYEALECRMVCGDFGANSDSALVRLANGKAGRRG